MCIRDSYISLWEKGDEKAKDVLIERNLRLVAHIAKKYTSNVYTMDDFISIGTIGLIKAINTYSSGKAARLATYAARCIAVSYTHLSSVSLLAPGLAADKASAAAISTASMDLGS